MVTMCFSKFNFIIFTRKHVKLPFVVNFQMVALLLIHYMQYYKIIRSNYFY